MPARLLRTHARWIDSIVTHAVYALLILAGLYIQAGAGLTG
jgi:hypothetical protein